MRPQLVSITPDTLNTDAFSEWKEYREWKRKPLSPFAEAKTIKMLSQYTPEQQQAIIDQSIQNDWQGLFPEKIASKRSTLVQDLTDRSWAR